MDWGDWDLYGQVGHAVVLTAFNPNAGYSQLGLIAFQFAFGADRYVARWLRVGASVSFVPVSYFVGGYSDNDYGAPPPDVMPLSLRLNATFAPVW